MLSGSIFGNAEWVEREAGEVEVFIEVPEIIEVLEIIEVIEIIEIIEVIEDIEVRRGRR